MNIDTTNLSAIVTADWQPIVDAILTEQARRNIVATYTSDLAAPQARMASAIAASSTKATAYDSKVTYQPGASVASGSDVYWWPGPGTIVNDDPASSTHWVKLPPKDTPATPWTTGMHLVPQMLVVNGGHTYRYVGADTASAPANWAPTGTTSTAAWTFIV